MILINQALFCCYNLQLFWSFQLIEIWNYWRSIFLFFECPLDTTMVGTGRNFCVLRSPDALCVGFVFSMILSKIQGRGGLPHFPLVMDVKAKKIFVKYL